MDLKSIIVGMVASVAILAQSADLSDWGTHLGSYGPAGLLGIVLAAVFWKIIPKIVTWVTDVAAEKLAEILKRLIEILDTLKTIAKGVSENHKVLVRMEKAQAANHAAVMAKLEGRSDT